MTQSTLGCPHVDALFEVGGGGGSSHVDETWLGLRLAAAAHCSLRDKWMQLSPPPVEVCVTVEGVDMVNDARAERSKATDLCSVRRALRRHP